MGGPSAVGREPREAAGSRAAAVAVAAAAGQTTTGEFRGHVEVTDVAAGGVWLAVYGDAAETFDKTLRSENAVGVSFSYYPFERIASKSVPKLKKLRRLRELHFEHTEMHSLHQLHSLGQMPGLSALRISADGNPVVAHPHFRSLTISLLPQLRSLNGSEVSAAEREAADRDWRRLKRLYGLASNGLYAQLAPLSYLHAMQLGDNAPPSPQRPASAAPASAAASKDAGAKAGAPGGEAGQREGADGAKANAKTEPTVIAASFVDRVVQHALAVDEKITQLNAVWPHVVAAYQARVRAEVQDRALFLRRYEAATRGETQGTVFAMLDSLPK